MVAVSSDEFMQEGRPAFWVAFNSHPAAWANYSALANLPADIFFPGAPKAFLRLISQRYAELQIVLNQS